MQALYLGTQAFFYCFRDLKDVTDSEAQGDYRCIPKGYILHAQQKIPGGFASSKSLSLCLNCVIADFWLASTSSCFSPKHLWPNFSRCWWVYI